MTPTPPNTPNPEQPSRDLLELYLDRMLPPDQTAAFESASSADADVLRQLRLQRRLDDALRSSFTPDLAGLFPAPQQTAPTTRKQFSIARVGAGVLVAGLLVAAILYYFTPESSGPGFEYRQTLAQGFIPYRVCRNDDEVAAFTRQAFGEALLIKRADGVSLVGWNYGGNVVSPSTVSLLAKVGDDKIVVFMDRAAADHAIRSPSGGLRMFRRQVGGIVLYEVTPRPKAEILDLAYQAPR